MFEIKIVFSCSRYWSSKYDDDIMDDRIALNLLYVQVGRFIVYATFLNRKSKQIAGRKFTEIMNKLLLHSLAVVHEISMFILEYKAIIS